MSTPLVEVDTYTADVVVPEGGDARNAASIRPALQALANRTKHLLAVFAARLGVRALNGHLFTQLSGWAHTGTTGSNLLASVDGAVATACIDALLVPGCTITGVAVCVTPGIARGTVGDRMSLTLYKNHVLSSGAETQIATNTDNGTATAAQSIALSVSEVVDLANYSYSVVLRAGADAGTHLDLAMPAGTVTLA